MATTRRPNIILILSDDQGPWAMGCAGNTDFITPHLDRLAAEGVRFDRFYCVSPARSPSRATLLTGQVPSQHGVHDWLSGGHVPEADAPAIRYLDSKLGYTQVLGEHGYTCALVGTWDLGDDLTPQLGLAHWRIHPAGSADAITDDALAFIAGHVGDTAPFYLSVHYPAPHALQPGHLPRPGPDPSAADAFETMPRDPVHPWSIPGHAPEPGTGQWHAQLRAYVAGVTAIDACVGRILECLDGTGLARNTIVWFLGANGFSAGHGGIWGPGNATWPLNMMENSMRVPAIVRLPEAIPAGVVRTEMVSVYDVAHTLLDQVGLAMPNASRLPGRSFAPLLSPGTGTDGDHLVILGEYGPVRMIRTPAWKYIHRYPYGPNELYDMVRDPHERQNLVDDPARGEIATLLRAELQRWFARYVDPAVDGLHEAVTGSGQFLRAGTGNQGRLAYRQDNRLAKERHPAPTPVSHEPGSTP